MHNAISLSIDAFRALSQQHAGEATAHTTPYTLISRHMPADLDTPVAALLKLRRGEHSFLLESVERGSQVGRYSFLGTDPHNVLTARNSICKLSHRDGSVQEETECKAPLDKLETLLSARKLIPPPGVDMPRFSGGAVGYAGYEVVGSLEPVQPAANDPLGLPDMAFAFYDTVVVFDHVQRTAQVITLAPLTTRPDAEYAQALERIDAVMQRLRRPAPFSQATRVSTPDPTVTSNRTQAEFERVVNEAKEHIAAGDIIQVVLSQRFQRRDDGRPLQHLPGTADGQPLALHVLPAVRRRARSSAPRPRCWCGCSDGKVDDPPDRGHAAARRRPAPRTPPWSRSCWPTRRSAPST